MNDVYIVSSAIGIILLIVVAILRFKISPIVALVAGAVVLALINGIAPEETIEIVLTGFGDLMAKVGLLLFFGLLIGVLLTYLGAVGKVAAALLRLFGARAMPYTFGATVGTVFASIFVEVNILIMAPLAKRIAPQLGQAGLARLTSSIMIGVETALTMVVPGIAVLALSGLLEVPVGLMLIIGLPIGVLTILSAVAIMELLFRFGLWKPAKDEVQRLEERIELANELADTISPIESPSAPAAAVQSEVRAELRRGPGAESPSAPITTVQTETAFGSTVALRQPPTLLAFAPLLLALVLIATTAIGGIFDFTSPVLEVIGNPTIALLIGFVGTQIIARVYGDSNSLGKALREGTAESGEILILTGVGACLAAVVKAIGIGDVLVNWFQPGSFAPLLIVWVIAAVLHIAIGSVTTSAITAAGILAPVAGALGVNPALIALAAGAGSMFIIHVTSNAFWMVSSMMGFTTRGGFKTVTLPVTVASLTGLFWVLIASLFI